LICFPAVFRGEPVFSFDDVECKYTSASQALQRIKEEGLYEYITLAATNIKQRPMKPADFEKKHPGATVLARAAISSETFPKGIQFYADVPGITYCAATTARLHHPLLRKYAVLEIVSRKKTRLDV
jgi:hypothetical protein